MENFLWLIYNGVTNDSFIRRAHWDSLRERSVCSCFDLDWIKQCLRWGCAREIRCIDHPEFDENSVSFFVILQDWPINDWVLSERPRWEGVSLLFHRVTPAALQHNWVYLRSLWDSIPRDTFSTSIVSWTQIEDISLIGLEV